MINRSVANADWFSRPQTQAIFSCLNREGYEVRAVGGAVRNALLNRPVEEVDFATTALPNDVIRLATDAGLKPVPTGIDHGTVTLIADGVPFEVTTLRRDVITDGRHAVVQFGGDWQTDASRRDFTMNALYADAKGQVYDPLGGIADLAAGRVRFIGDAHQRIREDYLRILRFFRFSAEYASGAFDAEALAAAIAERAGLLTLSRERIRMELLRILGARRAVDAVILLHDNGVLVSLLGGVLYCRRFEILCAIEAERHRSGAPVLRLAALAVKVVEDAERVAERLRLSNAEAEELKAYSLVLPRADPKIIDRQLYRDGRKIVSGRILLSWIRDRARGREESWKRALDLADHWEKPEFPVSGADLLALGWKAGPKIGETLKKLEAFWIEGGFSPSRETLLELAKTQAARDNS